MCLVGLHFHLPFGASCFQSHSSQSHAVTKKRGSEITQYTDYLHDPKRPCFPDLLHLNQTSALPQNTNCLLTLPEAHYKIRDVQVLCLHTTTEQISHHPSPASPIHTNANKGNSFITNYIHCPKAQA